MNGSRLSDDAAFLAGTRTLRGFLEAEPGQADPDAAERALRMIAMRYPEEAEVMRGLVAEQAADRCRQELSAVELRYQEDLEE